MFLRLSPEEYKALCGQVMDRDSWKCRNPRCQYRGSLHCHHVIFKSDGGDDTSWNLITLCSDCHSAVHAYKLFISVPENNWVGIGGGCDGKVVFSWGS